MSVLNTADLATATGRTKQTILGWARSGKLPFKRDDIPRSAIIYPPEALNIARELASTTGIEKRAALRARLEKSGNCPRKTADAVNPLVLRLREIADEKIQGSKAVSESAGLATNTMRDWLAHGVMPSVGNVTSVANVLGYYIEIVRVQEPSDAALGGKRKARVVNPDADPLVHELLRLIDGFGTSGRLVALAAGIKASAMKHWWSIRANSPRLDSIEKAFAVLGYGLKLLPITRAPVEDKS